jgi:hypothetical protein
MGADVPAWRLRLVFACAHPAIDAAMRDKGLDPESDPVTLPTSCAAPRCNEKIGARAHDAMEADRKSARNILYLL